MFLRDKRYHVSATPVPHQQGHPLQDLDGPGLDTISSSSRGRLMSHINHQNRVSTEPCQRGRQHETFEHAEMMSASATPAAFLMLLTSRSSSDDNDIVFVLFDFGVMRRVVVDVYASMTRRASSACEQGSRGQMENSQASRLASSRSSPAT